MSVNAKVNLLFRFFCTFFAYFLTGRLIINFGKKIQPGIVIGSLRKLALRKLGFRYAVINVSIDGSKKGRCFYI